MTERDDGPRFDPRGRTLVFMAVADELAAKIEDGTYAPEARLPSVADLVHEYGCSRESVRRAIGELRERGLVDTVSGKGSFVTRPDERTPNRPA
jgi:DNA-binding GntR family transcriptional regulator